jgi:hypothetical protein
MRDRRLLLERSCFCLDAVVREGGLGLVVAAGLPACLPTCPETPTEPERLIQPA